MTGLKPVAQTAHTSVATIHGTLALAIRPSCSYLNIGFDASHIESRTCFKPTRRPTWTMSKTGLKPVAHTALTSVATIYSPLALAIRPSCSPNIGFDASHIESRTCLTPTRRYIWTLSNARLKPWRIRRIRPWPRLTAHWP
jgi:hypothetical protein